MIDLTWYNEDGRDVPYALINPEPVSYELSRTIEVNGKRVVERSRVAFVVATAVRATPAQVEQWRAQP